MARVQPNIKTKPANSILISFFIDKFFKFTADVNNSRRVGNKAEPEQFNLILTDHTQKTGDADNRQYVREIMSATGNHSDRGSSAGNGKRFAGNIIAENKRPQITIKPNLNAKAESQTDNIIPIAEKLA